MTEKSNERIEELKALLAREGKEVIVYDAGERVQLLNWKTIAKHGLPKADYLPNFENDRFSTRCLVEDNEKKLSVTRFDLLENFWMPILKEPVDGVIYYAELE